MAVSGELEHAVMGILWSRQEPLSVRDVHERLSAERDLAYTTVMTVLDRLAKKGLATRNRVRRAWLYRPARTQVDEIAAGIVAQLSDLNPASRNEVLDTVNAHFTRADANQ